MALQAAIISIGDELILGQTVDTNSAWLSEQLAQIGIGVSQHITLADSQSDIAEHLSRLAKTVDVIIATGGLGPTDDDLTRHALAEVLGTELELHQMTLDKMTDMFARFKRPMAQRNRIQAMIPKGCAVIDNPIGTACGMMVEIGAAHAFFLPGVPSEMRMLCTETVFPLVTKLAEKTRDKQVIVSRTLCCFGQGESTVAEMLGDMMTRHRNPVVNSTVARGIISLRINATAADRETAQKMIAPVEAELRQRLGDIVFGSDDDTLASVVVKRLMERRATLATAESCTGGMLAGALTDIPGVSSAFLGGWITYSNDAKISMLRVDSELIDSDGAVSESVARQLAQKAREYAQSDYALSITGIAGPSGGTAEKPIGLVFIGLADGSGTLVSQNILHGDRKMIRTRAVNTALDMLRRRIS